MVGLALDLFLLGLVKVAHLVLEVLLNCSVLVELYLEVVNLGGGFLDIGLELLPMVGLQSFYVVVVDLLVVLHEQVLSFDLVVVEVLFFLELDLDVVLGLLQEFYLCVLLGHLNGVVLVDHGYLRI